MLRNTSQRAHSAACRKSVEDKMQADPDDAQRLTDARLITTIIRVTTPTSFDFEKLRENALSWVNRALAHGARLENMPGAHAQSVMVRHHARFNGGCADVLSAVPKPVPTFSHHRSYRLSVLPGSVPSRSAAWSVRRCPHSHRPRRRNSGTEINNTHCTVTVDNLGAPPTPEALGNSDRQHYNQRERLARGMCVSALPCTSTESQTLVSI